MSAAEMIPSPSEACAMTSPQGSMMHDLPNVLAATRVLAPLRSSDDERLRLDGAGAQEREPVVLACHQRERRRDHDDLDARRREGAETFRETKVVTNREAYAHSVDRHGDRALPGGCRRGLPVGCAVAELDVEQVDLAVTGEEPAIRTESGARVVRTQRIAGSPACRPR